MCANRESFTLINPVCAVQLQESEGPAAPSTFFIVKWCGNWRILINIHYFDNYPLQWLQMNWTKAWDTSVNTSRCGLNPHFAGCGEFTVDSVEKVMGIIAMDMGLGVQELNVFLRVIFSKSKFQTKHWQTWGPNSRAMRWIREEGEPMMNVVVHAMTGTGWCPPSSSVVRLCLVGVVAWNTWQPLGSSGRY